MCQSVFCVFVVLGLFFCVCVCVVFLFGFPLQSLKIELSRNDEPVKFKKINSLIENTNRAQSIKANVMNS